MDFKVAGTSEFVTAIQLDTKLDGIPASVLTGALTQAKDARTTILAVLNVGQKILVKITKIDDRGKLSLEPVVEEPADQEGRAAASEGPEAPAEG